MIFDYSLAALVTVGLMIYLTCALLKPGSCAWASNVKEIKIKIVRKLAS